ncbi:MAG: SUKH-4 family immunity protein [Saccharofermentans sp.]|nr:SUKH-4 family immunity protein [Saccharofermentans sp.]
MYDQQKKEVLMDLSKEIKYDAVHVDFLSERDVEILTKIGIPDSLAPYIDIEPEKNYGGYSLIDRINIFEQYPLDREDFKHLCMLGRIDDRYIVITGDGEVAVFDVDADELFPVNKSLDAFLDSAFEFAQFIKSVNEKNGECAYIDGNYTEDDVDLLREALTAIDDTSIEEGFWADELVNLIDCIES